MFSAPRHRAAGALLALFVALAVPAPPVLAQEALVRDGISQDEAVAMVREQTGGKVVRVDRKIESGAVVYRIRVLTPDGRLREYRVDAATGTVR